MMLWTASTTGIATCQITVAVVERRKSAYGYKRLCKPPAHNFCYAPESRPSRCPPLTTATSHPRPVPPRPWGYTIVLAVLGIEPGVLPDWATP